MQCECTIIILEASRIIVEQLERAGACLEAKHKKKSYRG